MPSLTCKRTLYVPGAMVAALLARSVFPLMLKKVLSVSPTPLTRV